jgi:phosphoglycolate phosphatase
MIKAIIFDYDGVIVDSFVSIFEVYKKICMHFKVTPPKTVDEFRANYGYHYIECLANLGIQAKDFDEANSIFAREIVKMEHGVFSDITDVIEALSKKYDLYIVSASLSKEILPKITKFGLIDFFKNVYCGGDDGVRKSILINNILKENNYTVDEVVSIGDRAIDYEVAKKVGISDDNIILVTYGWGLDKTRIGKVRIADKPNDILSFI